MIKLDEILKPSSEVDKLVIEAFVSTYEQAEIEGKNEMLLNLLKEYVQQNNKLKTMLQARD